MLDSNLSSKACFTWELPPSASAAWHDKSDSCNTQLWFKHEQSSPTRILNTSSCLTLGKGHCMGFGKLHSSEEIWPPHCLSPAYIRPPCSEGNQPHCIPQNPFSSLQHLHKYRNAHSGSCSCCLSTWLETSNMDAEEEKSGKRMIDTEIKTKTFRSGRQKKIQSPCLVRRKDPLYQKTGRTADEAFSRACLATSTPRGFNRRCS